MNRTSLRSLVLLGTVVACSSGDGSANSAKPAATSATPGASASPKASSSAAASAQPSVASASAASRPAPPSPESFGPNVTKEVVEAVNASNAYDTNTPAFAIDGKPATAWSAPPAGAWLEVGLFPGTKVDGIELGGQRVGKNSTGDERWDVNGVMKKIQVTWDGGEGLLTFDRATDKGVRKKLGIGAMTRKIRITVLEVDKGSKSEDVDIDELAIFGTKARSKRRISPASRASARRTRWLCASRTGPSTGVSGRLPKRAESGLFAGTSRRRLCASTTGSGIRSDSSTWTTRRSTARAESACRPTSGRSGRCSGSV
jgi:hypothetical protein